MVWPPYPPVFQLLQNSFIRCRVSTCNQRMPCLLFWDVRTRRFYFDESVQMAPLGVAVVERASAVEQASAPESEKDKERFGGWGVVST